MFSIALDELAAELVGAIEQVELAAGLDAHAFEDDRAERAAAAAQRHGDDRGRRRRSAGGTISARARRIATAAGADGVVGARRGRRARRRPGSDEACSTRWRARRSWIQTDVRSAPNSRLAPWQKMSRPAARFSVADRLRGELVEQRADVALQLVALAQAEQLERGR